MAYALISDLSIYGCPANALNDITNEQLQGAIDNACAIVDSYLRGRYVLPIVSWGVEITEATCRIAVYNLMNIRGFEASGLDSNIVNRYSDTIQWLNKVQRQSAHPNITDSTPATGQYARPSVVSTSVIYTNSSRTAKNRGW
jgi:phage gp36-like protein